MILYLDSSALVKRYVLEVGSQEVRQHIDKVQLVGTSIVSRKEYAAAFAKAARVSAITIDEAEAALRLFRTDWADLVRVQVTEMLVARADEFAWRYGLRGYDAIQMASAVIWRESMRREFVLGTFDRQLWTVGCELGLTLLPERQP